LVWEVNGISQIEVIDRGSQSDYLNSIGYTEGTDYTLVDGYLLVPTENVSFQGYLWGMPAPKAPNSAPF
jgi:hypothetical protein